MPYIILTGVLVRRPQCHLHHLILAVLIHMEVQPVLLATEVMRR